MWRTEVLYYIYYLGAHALERLGKVAFTLASSSYNKCISFYVLHITVFINRWCITWEGIPKVYSAVGMAELESNPSLHTLWPWSGSISILWKWTRLRNPRAHPDLLNQNTHVNNLIVQFQGWVVIPIVDVTLWWAHGHLFAQTHTYLVLLFKSLSRHAPTNQEYVNLFFAPLWHISDFISLSCLLTLSLFPIQTICKTHIEMWW